MLIFRKLKKRSQKMSSKQESKLVIFTSIYVPDLIAHDSLVHAISMKSTIQSILYEKDAPVYGIYFNYLI